MVRRYGEPLVGPPAADAISPVPEADLRAAMVGDLELLLDDLEPDTRNVLLTLARIWCTLATGEIRSKDEAAAWALERLPDEHRPVLAHARAAYLGAEADRLGRSSVDASDARRAHARRDPARSAADDDASRGAAPAVRRDRANRVDVPAAERALAVGEHAAAPPEHAVAEERVGAHAA